MDWTTTWSGNCRVGYRTGKRHPCQIHVVLNRCFHSGVTFWYSLIFNLSAHKVCTQMEHLFVYTLGLHSTSFSMYYTTMMCKGMGYSCFRLHLWGGVLLCNWKCYTGWCDIRFSQSHNKPLHIHGKFGRLFTATTYGSVFFQICIHNNH